MLRKTPFETVQKVLIISFLAIACMCCLLILIALLLTLSTKINIHDWDLLAFIGSIIGGFITWLGVRITILEQKKDKEIELYYKDIDVLYFIVQDTQFIINVPSYEITKNDAEGKLVVDEYETLQMQLDFTVDFIEIINKKLSDLMKSVEWEVFRVIDIEMKNLAVAKVFAERFENYYSREGSDNMKMRIKRYLEIAGSIHSRLSEYKDTRTDKYLQAKFPKTRQQNQ
ncbi:hypothetical protein [Paenibacillus sp. AR247]|uniref:hypothetical protein n=1 Tax=Paenibacillus sp. AR247 TaxID=1631599 RepID=UPI000CFA1698|nr:hypothetical protein [Paenibacillus sp. AR247]PQP85457.1 hypothetical protein CPT76_36225 [Paenibacillus sp. AR247]